MDKSIWWLASYPKSGNTWIRALLSAYQTNGALDINQMRGVISDNQVYFYTVVAHKQLDELEDYEWICLRYAALLHLVRAAREGEKALFLKTHNANVAVEGLQMIPWPMTAGAIYVVRDPRDVVLSYANHFSTSVDEAIKAMEHEHNSVIDKKQHGVFHILATWSMHVNSWLQEKPFPVGLVKYEDLMDDTEYRFTKLLEFLDIPVDADRVRRAVDASRFDSLRAQEDKKGFSECPEKVERFFRSGKAGGWRDVLTEPQVKRIEAVHGEVMQRLGYVCEYRNAA